MAGELVKIELANVTHVSYLGGAAGIAVGGRRPASMCWSVLPIWENNPAEKLSRTLVLHFVLLGSSCLPKRCFLI